MQALGPKQSRKARFLYARAFVGVRMRDASAGSTQCLVFRIGPSSFCFPTRPPPCTSAFETAPNDGVFEGVLMTTEKRKNEKRREREKERTSPPGGSLQESRPARPPFVSSRITPPPRPPQLSHPMATADSVKEAQDWGDDSEPT